jgi:nickel/cobalt transporter (NicO) family protein
MLGQLVAVQQWIHQALMGHLDTFARTHDWQALIAVLPVGILFGAVHALTPGHSKSVLASYLLGSDLRTAKATGVAAALSITHVASAVVIALMASELVTRTLVGAGRVPVLENLSRGLLVGIGVWLLVRAVRGERHIHGEGAAVGFVAGLVPCPLTLFMMILASTKGVPEAGVGFAVTMAMGVLLTLTGVAALTVLARSAVTRVVEYNGASLNAVVRVLNGVAGLLLVAVTAAELTG